MANEITIRVTAKDDASKVFGVIDQKAQGLGGTLSKVGAIAGGFLAANVVAGAAQKITGFIGDSIKAASDLEQSIGGVESVFKDSSAEILAWGQTAAKAAGLSKQQFNSIAAPLGAMLKNAGVENFSQEVIKLTQIGADLAATFGGDVEDAMTAITAAFRGETDPIERYGVAMNAAKVEAEALAMTGKTVASSLTEQEKAMARLSLITQQTADAQGQFARESETAAGKAAVEAAQYENLQATLGEKLLPIQVKITEAKIKLVEVIANQLIPKLEELYAVHWPAVSAAIQDVAAVVQEYWPTVQAVLALVLEDIITRIQGFIQQFQGIVQIVQGVADLVKAVIEGDWRAAWESLNTIVEGAINLVVGTIRTMFGEVADQMFQAGEEIINGLIRGIKSKLSELENLFKSITDKIPKIKGPMEKDRKLLQPTGQAIMEGLAAGLATGFSRTVTPLLGSAAPRIAGSVGGAAPSVASPHGVGALAGGGFAFNVHQMNIYEKDDREIRDVAFGVQASMNNELRRRGVLLGSTTNHTSSGVIRGRP